MSIGDTTTGASTTLREEVRNQLREAGGHRSLQKQTAKYGPDLLALLILGAIVSMFFFKTVFLGLPISKICRLADWDSVFADFSKGAVGLMDPSSVQLMIPSYFLVAKIFQSGAFPLWNPYTGFGYPLIADPQTAILAPLRVCLDLFPTMHVYNLYLVLQILIAAMTSFVLARTIGLSRLASLLVAECYTFCPYNIRAIECGYCYPLNPLVAALFVRAAQKPTLGRMFLAGVICALDIYSGHPESAFWGISFACLLSTVILICTKYDGGGLRSLLAAAKIIAIAGIVAFMLTAPMLLPFIEYLKNSDSYKFTSTAPACVPFLGQLYNFLSPGFGPASPFLGILAPVMVVLAFFAPRHLRAYALSIALVAAVAVVATGRVGSLNDFFWIRPLRVIICVYCLPLVLLSLSLLAGIGAESLKQRLQTNAVSIKLIAVFAFACFATLSAPIVFNLMNVDLSKGNFDLMLPDMSFGLSALKRNGIVAAIFAALLVLLCYLSSKRHETLPKLARHAGGLLIASALVLNFISVAAISKDSLPVQPAFDYYPLPVFSFVQKTGERMVATGAHLCKPMTNALYGVYDIRAHNPLFPKRFMSFMRLCGAETDLFNQIFSDRLPRTLDLAGVKYVATQGSIWSVDEPLVPQAEVNLNLEIAPGLSLSKIACSAQRQNRDVRCRITSLNSARAGASLQKYSLIFLVLDQTGNASWTSDAQPMERLAQNSNTEFAAPLPAGCTSHKLFIGMQILDNASHSCVRTPSATMIGDTVLLAPVPEAVTTAPSRFRLLRDFPGHIRLYENTSALPRAYLSYTADVSTGEQETAKLLASNGFDPFNQVVIEGEGATPLISRLPIEKVGRKELSPTEIEILCHAKERAVLVLTDAFYPGWVASVDGKEKPIHRANSMFRGIYLDAGPHRVRFVYRPDSFVLGVGCAVLSVIIMLLYGFLKCRRKNADQG